MPYPLDTVPSAQEWLKTDDGCQHFLRIWTADNAKAVAVYLHGIEGHSLWFAETAQELCRRGITVYAVDRRGSGLSKEKRGDITAWRIFTDDAEYILTEIHKRHEDTALFLIGGCWGAKTAAVLATKPDIQKRLKGLLFSSPAFSVKIDLNLQKKLLIAWRFFTNNLSTLSIPLEPSHFTSNPAYLPFIANDPLRLLEASPRFFVHSQILGLLAMKSPTKIELPVLIVQAEHDDIVKMSGLKLWFAKLKSEDKELNIISNTKHSLDFDKKQDEYRNALADWILTRATKR